MDSLNPGVIAAQWLTHASGLALQDDVIAAARRSLIDSFACCIGGSHDPVADIVRRRAVASAPTGPAPLITGGNMSPASAAFVHATAAHAHDLDDTRIYTDAHCGGSTRAAVLSQLHWLPGADDMALCQVFVAGSEAPAIAAAQIGGLTRELASAITAPEDRA